RSPAGGHTIRASWNLNRISAVFIGRRARVPSHLNGDAREQRAVGLLTNYPVQPRVRLGVCSGGRALCSHARRGSQEHEGGTHGSILLHLRVCFYFARVAGTRNIGHWITLTN